MKKRLIIIFILACIYSSFQAQDTVTNDLRHLYHQMSPPIIYSYDESTQTHNYSNNWDLDGDGQKDEIHFVGTGGAHLYYYLKVVLSSERKPRVFERIETDFPHLVATCNKADFQEMVSGFSIVFEENKCVPVLVIMLDESTFYNNKKWLDRKGAKTQQVCLRFENGRVNFGEL